MEQKTQPQSSFSFLRRYENGINHIALSEAFGLYPQQQILYFDYRIYRAR